LLASQTVPSDPLAVALSRKAATNGRGATTSTIVAAGEGWRVVDIVCTFGPPDRPFEERQSSTSISLVLSGTFVYRSDRGPSLLSPGALLLGNAGDVFECSHRHGEGDRCLSFQYDPALFERVAHAAGASRPTFEDDRLPPLRALAPLSARARTAIDDSDAMEEVALELAGAAIEVAGDSRRGGTAAGDVARVARVLRRVEAQVGNRHTLSELAETAGLSRFHFLRTFKRVTGVTPHQWLLRARLREAARRLVATCEPVTALALDVGFDDLSNFIRSFRAEFGVSPSRYRARA
jgi:AraC family transcriptional regulator